MYQVLVDGAKVDAWDFACCTHLRLSDLLARDGIVGPGLRLYVTRYRAYGG